MNLLEISNLNLDLGNFKLKDINLVLPQGTIVGILGKNGSGKTTLIEAIGGYYREVNNSIQYNGIRMLEDEVEVKKQLLIMYDNFNVKSGLKIKKIIKNIHIAYEKMDIDKLNENLERFEIDQESIYEVLSLGQKKKLHFCILLSINPRIFVLDEPTSNIDSIDRLEILDLLMEYMQDDTKGIVYSTNIISDIEKVADYIGIMHKGKLIEFALKDELLDRYRFIRTSKEELTDKLKSKMIGIKENEYSYEGLVEEMEDGVKPDLETIFNHLVHDQEEKNDEQY